MSEMDVLELNIANAALALATLVCVLMVGWGVVVEVAERLRARWAQSAAQDDHALALPQLGLTMADGGEKITDKESESTQ